MIKYRSFILYKALWLLVLVIPLAAFSQEGNLVFDKVYSQALEGNLLGDSPKRNVTVYLPPGYDENPTRYYPVVYLLHGYTGNNLLWTGKGYLGGGFNIKNITDSLILQGKIRPMILVAPDAHNKYRGSFYTNSSVTGNWEDFIAKEPIEYIDKTYRTLAQYSSRGIAGHSMGGYGIIKLTMKHPDTYCCAYALSSCCLDFEEIYLNRRKEDIIRILQIKSANQFEELHLLTLSVVACAAAVAPNLYNSPFFADFPMDINGEVVDSLWQRWLKHDPMTMVDLYKTNLISLKKIRMDCGTSDVLFSINRSFSQALTDAGISHEFEEYPGDHVNQIRQRMVTKVLPFFSDELEFEMVKEGVSVQPQEESTTAYGEI
ncbi:MAG: alpha/beta hydrolase [Planctomycetota bacterium]|jgi:S-formylglutathione hydrolase FrmB